MEVAVQFAMEN